MSLPSLFFPAVLPAAAKCNTGFWFRKNAKKALVSLQLRTNIITQLSRQCHASEPVLARNLSDIDVFLMSRTDKQGSIILRHLLPEKVTRRGKKKSCITSHFPNLTRWTSCLHLSKHYWSGSRMKTCCFSEVHSAVFFIFFSNYKMILSEPISK